MKKKLFTLLLLVTVLVGGISAQTYHPISGSEKVSCSEANIAANDWITYEAAKYSSRDKCAGVAESIPNLSSADRVVVFYIEGCESFDVVADGNKAPRNLEIKVNGVVVENEVWANGCTTHEGLKTNTTGQCKVEIAGVNGSVYLSSVIFHAPSGPSDNATLSSIKIGGEEATLNETTYSYELPASYEGETASVDITPASDKAVVTVSTDATPNTTAGVYTATVAIGTPVTVSVTAEAGNISEYTLSLTKAVTKSSDTSLSALTVDGQAAMLIEGETGKYTFDIPYAYDGALEIIATPTDNLSTVSEITAPTVAAGTSVDVKFTVTAEDESTQEYTLTITRAAASTECTLKSFSINGFAGTIDETAKTVEVKVVKDYDFSHTPVMNISALATAAWDKEAMKVTVTAEDGVAATEYTVSPAAENIQPFAASAYPYELSFAAATYTEHVEWIYGAPYNANQKDPTNTEAVGCYELASESAEGNIAKGINALNIYLAKCGTLTLKVAATGGRNLVATVNGNQCGSLVIDSNNKGKYCDLVCKVDSDEPVVVTVTATGSNGGTRVYGMNVTEPIGLCIGSQATDGMNIYATDGTLYISSTETKIVNIYGIDGRLVKTVELNEGMNTIDGLVAGIYLVNNQKVVINK